MNFEQFKNQARLYVLGALYPDELEQFEHATTQFGSRAKAWIRDCCALRDAFALSLRPTSSAEALTSRLGCMVQKRAKATS